MPTPQQLNEMKATGKSWAEVASTFGLSSESKARRMAKQITDEKKPIVSLPAPAPEAGGPSLPTPFAETYDPFIIDTVGVCGIINDLHVPYHDLRTIEGWVAECKHRGAKTLFLNGDILDFYHASDFFRERSRPRIKDEIEKGRQLLEYLRATFPKARIILKEGNHDERFRKMLVRYAQEIEELEEIQLQNLLRASQLGVEWVKDKRVVMIGKLPAVHGHEFQGAGGVMPARWLYLRTGDSAICGHFHQQSNYTFRTIGNHEVGLWSVGCACFLAPAYRPLNQWSNGWAMAEVSNGGAFQVTNRRLLKDGTVA